ncbi:MAG TPA: MerR family transcriptional regulator [Piscirickettsiaceae bacterium]|nr:MerR family transcriptional regulator [Piscirickettsiaceae bacterium]
MAVIQIEQWRLELPDKKYFTIGEVSQLCGLKSHVLRYWEKAFPMLKPVKRQGRRYYQHKDIQLIMEIKHLLYEQGFTIDGASNRLRRRHQNLSELETDHAALNRLRQAREELAEFIDWLEKQKGL